MQQQLPSMPTMPEQQAIDDMTQWGQPVGWPLGPRAQQPYPAVSVWCGGSVKSALRRLAVAHVRPRPKGCCQCLARTSALWQLSWQIGWSSGGSQACRLQRRLTHHVVLYCLELLQHVTLFLRNSLCTCADI